MWIISKEQLTAISNSMRKEFEQRACFSIMQKGIFLSKEEIQQIVYTQTDKIVQYNIDTEEAMMTFIHLSFKYPVLRAATLSEGVHEILSSEFDDCTKIENMINLLKNNDYVI